MAFAGRVVAVKGLQTGLDFTTNRILTESGDSTPDPSDEFGAALAAGDWNDDGYDDLGVGIPGENVGDDPVVFNAGRVQIFLGGDDGLSPGASEDFAQHDLFDRGENFDEMGRALAFGHFDGGDSAALAVGTPYEDTSTDIVLDDNGVDTEEEFLNAGCVYVIAPWRQVLALVSGNAAAYNCDHTLVFSQRPWDHIRPASTTKIMTVLLGCEAIMSAAIDSSAYYRVPNWVSWVGGSGADLANGDSIRFIDLMRACVAASGNDAAYGIADVISYGGDAPAYDVSDFVSNEMSRRAAELGMSDTHFACPDGKDWPEWDWGSDAPSADNYTTAADMATLARTAMDNPIFAGIVGAETQTITIKRPLLPGLPFWYEETEIEYPFLFLTSLRAQIAQASGVKPGGTTKAGKNAVGSADSSGFRAIADGYTIPPDSTGSNTRLAGLLRLAFDACSPPITSTIAAAEEPGPFLTLSHDSTHQNHQKGTGTDMNGASAESVVVDVYRQHGSTPAAFELKPVRRSEARMAAGDSAFFRLNPFQSYDEIRIMNSGDHPATIQVTVSHPASQATITLPPHGDVRIPAYTGTVLAPFLLKVRNLSSSRARLDITERYRFYLTLPAPPGSAGFSTLLTHAGELYDEGLFLYTTGHDSISGNEIFVQARAPGAATASSVLEESDNGKAVQSIVLRVTPNPFGESAKFVFSAAAEGNVRLSIHDVTGRVVRTLDARLAELAGPREIRWDGRDQRGRRVAAGLYFYRCTLDGHSAGAGKLVLRR